MRKGGGVEYIMRLESIHYLIIIACDSQFIGSRGWLAATRYNCTLSPATNSPKNFNAFKLFQLIY